MRKGANVTHTTGVWQRRLSSGVAVTSSEIRCFLHALAYPNNHSEVRAILPMRREHVESAHAVP